MDEDMRSMFASSLEDLTFNSKPIINSLTMIAGDNIGSADAIVDAIEARFMAVEPKQKLPCLYLIDSILKNIGKDYIGMFSQNIASLFVRAYEKVDAKVRNNFIRVRKTWGGIFPPNTLQNIDTKLQKFGVAPGPSADPRRNPRRSSRDLPDPSVVDDVVTQVMGKPPARASDPRQHAPRNRGSDPRRPQSRGQPMGTDPRRRNVNLQNNHRNTAREYGHSSAHTQLPQSGRDSRIRSQAPHTIGDHGPSEAELMIEEQNKLIREAEERLASGTLNARKERMVKEQLDQLRFNRAKAMDNLQEERKMEGVLREHNNVSAPRDYEEAKEDTQPPDVNLLLEQLMASGVLPTTLPGNSEVNSGDNGVSREGKHKSSGAQSSTPDIVLGESNLKHRHGGVISMLYENLPQQCTNCGLRFNVNAKDAFASHLDWHFRMNRKEKEKLKRASSRRWFMSEKEWLEYKEVDDKDDKPVSFFDTQQSEEEEYETVSCSVNLPDGSEAVNECAVCGDKFSKFWSDKAEAWHFNEAIRVGTQTYHSRCHKDAVENGELKSPRGSFDTGVSETSPRKRRRMSSGDEGTIAKKSK
eukprot:Nk52_evm10s1762 gene=Nk52_evmTU10s1762